MCVSLVLTFASEQRGELYRLGEASVFGFDVTLRVKVRLSYHKENEILSDCNS